MRFLDSFRESNGVNSCFISSLSVAEFLIIAMKPDVSDLLEYNPFPIAGFHLQGQLLAFRAAAVLQADD